MDDRIGQDILQEIKNTNDMLLHIASLMEKFVENKEQPKEIKKDNGDAITKTKKR